MRHQRRRVTVGDRKNRHTSPRRDLASRDDPSGAPDGGTARITGVLIGAHVNSRGGIDRAIDNALAIGAEVFQTHPTPPQQWRPLQLTPEALEAYTDKYRRSGLRGHYLHAIYLINLATPKESHSDQSVTSLITYMELAAHLHAEAVIFHPGSHLGAGFSQQLPAIQRCLVEVLARSESPASLLIENSAGSGGCVGCRFDEIGRMLEASDDSRLGVCLDTQHMYASGYDVRTAEAVAHSLGELDSAVGLERVRAVHANDSKRELGSNVDRHANIGEGEIGEDGFALLLRHPGLSQLPWLLEVPGVERAGTDLEQINRLRACAGLEPAVSRTQAAV